MKRGIYIHIPFCVKKCNYCAFLSFDAYTSPRKEYTDALVRETELRASLTEDRETVDTVYIGGGTPSVLDVSQLRDIMHAVNECYDVKPDAEITLEANPATLGIKDGVTLAKLQAYRYMGINRLSMGVQAMDNARLDRLGRIHTKENVTRDMELIRKKGFDNVSLDLMFSVPGETTADALADLKEVIGFGPEHISCYSLQIEEGTPFGDMAANGELIEVSDEEDRATYHEICRILRESGYEHYEISNFAKPGYRSRHNSLYWNMDDYIGLGLGASGFTGGVRYKNTEDLEEYIALISEGRLPTAEEHVNTAFDNISEAVFTGLRRTEGVTYEEAADAYFRAPDAEGSRPEDSEACRDLFRKVFAEAEKEAEEYAERGLLIIDEKGLRLTEQGIDISNSIMSLFV
ncbi:MAG: radical SAM family heme chaperone HemW [Mogibacterium sp.]|nr:radical SAM family heme chaperone HemW [Mogibacterium sp.]